MHGDAGLLAELVGLFAAASRAHGARVRRFVGFIAGFDAGVGEGDDIGAAGLAAAELRSGWKGCLAHVVMFVVGRGCG